MKKFTLVIIFLILPCRLLAQSSYNLEDWKQVHSFNTVINGNYINCFDSLNCYLHVVSNTLIIYKSSDGGSSWFLLHDNTTPEELGISLADTVKFPETRAHQTPVQNYYFISTHSRVRGNGNPIRIEQFNPGGTSNILKSIDGGVSFEFIYSDSLLKLQHNPPFEITELFMLDSLVGLRFFADSFYVETHSPVKLGSNKSMLVTYDGGHTYERREFPSEHIRDMIFNGRIYSQIKSREIIYLTTDELFHYNLETDVWRKIGNDLPKCISYATSHLHRDTISCIYDDMVFVNDNVGYIVVGTNMRLSPSGIVSSTLDTNSKEILYKTNDGGNTWSKVLDTAFIPFGYFSFGSLSNKRTFLSFVDECNGLTYLEGGISTGNEDLTMHRTSATKDGFNSCDIPLYDVHDPKLLNSSFFHGYYSAMAWAGRTPLFVIGNGRQVFRYEGDFFKFEISPPNTYDAFPPDSSKAHNTNLDFEWDMNEDDVTYSFQLSREGDFSDLVASKTLELPIINMNILEYFQEYYWRVATHRCGYTKWSEVFTFRTRMPDVVTLSPDCNAEEQATTLTLKWATVKGAEYYRIRLATDAEFENIIREADSLESTQYILSNLDNKTSYFWRVQAYRNDETGDWSELCGFTTEKGVGVSDTEYSNFITVEHSKTAIKFDLKDFSALQGNITISLYTINGNLLKSLNEQLTRGSNTYEMDISTFITGAYFYSIIIDNVPVNSGVFQIVR